MKNNPKYVHAAASAVRELLSLYDLIRKNSPEAANDIIRAAHVDFLNPRDTMDSNWAMPEFRAICLGITEWGELLATECDLRGMEFARHMAVRLGLPRKPSKKDQERCERYEDLIDNCWDGIVARCHGVYCAD